VCAKYVIIGGNEDVYPEEPIFQAMVHGIDSSSRIVLVPTASGYPVSTSRTYQTLFKSMGFMNVEVLHVANKEDAGDSQKIKLVQEAQILFFVGGNQNRLLDTLANTLLHELFKSMCSREDVVIAGTSAGAMALGPYMIKGGDYSGALKKGEIPIGAGLGLLDNVIVDTHLITRNRILRLFHAVSKHPRMLGIGIGNDTGVVVQKDLYTVVGTDLAIAIDGQDLDFNNLMDVGKSETFGVGPFNVTIIPVGFSYNRRTKKIQVADLGFPLTHT
jgi:cyanophycinase